MPLMVSYPTRRGNTVPYPPLFDDIRRNHGFVDLRGRSELVDALPEAAGSQALRTLLLQMAELRSPLMSLGCDLGEHKRTRERLHRRYWAGGYIQVVPLPLTLLNRSRLHAIARSAEIRLAAEVSRDNWIVAFALCATHLQFEGLLESETLWIWFDAAASATERALESGERLISSLSAGLRNAEESES